MTAILRCPECGEETVGAQNKAFVTQGISIRDDGTFDYEVWETDDVEFDGPEWYVCRSCGDHAEDVRHFLATTRTVCDSCDDAPVKGVRWPTATNDDDTRPWVERCDSCETYASDDAALRALLAIYEGRITEYGWAKPVGTETLVAYLVAEGE